MTINILIILIILINILLLFRQLVYCELVASVATVQQKINIIKTELNLINNENAKIVHIYDNNAILDEIDNDDNNMIIGEHNAAILNGLINTIILIESTRTYWYHTLLNLKEVKENLKCKADINISQFRPMKREDIRNAEIFSNINEKEISKLSKLF